MATFWNALGPTFRPPGSILIAHLSDLHLGSKGATKVEEVLMKFLRDQVKPDLMLVTGDLVHSPSEKGYKNAKTFLDAAAARNLDATAEGTTPTPYLVCPGNHDRFPKGVLRKLRAKHWRAVSAHFDKTFSGKIMLSDKFEKVTVGSGTSAWEIGLVGADSSNNADAWARGYVAEADFAALAAQVRGKECDLCIFLVHHHLLSIPGLEIGRHNKKGDWFNLTCLVNSGSLLEALASAHIDLVLHGHEHEPHWASYGSFVEGRSRVRVVGAGSATGNDSLKGCSLEAARFNLLVLHPNRSGMVFRMAYKEQDWAMVDEAPLFKSAEIRHSRMRRWRSDLRGEINSEIVKQVRFTRERDIWVRWVFTNWLLEPLCTHKIMNGSGVPDRVAVQLDSKDGEPVEFKNLRPNKIENQDHSWAITFPVPEKQQGKPLTMVISYRWRGGAVLTDTDLKCIQDRAGLGMHRNQGCEFATIHAPGAVASASIVLSLPPEFTPPALDVCVLDEKEQPREHEVAEVRGRLRILEGGNYVLEVPFPRRDWSYQLVWHPVPEASVVPLGTHFDADAFAKVANERGKNLLDAFSNALQPSPFWKQCTLSLYIWSLGDQEAECVAFAAPGSEDLAAHQKPPEKMDLIGDRNFLGQAHWGLPIITPVPAPDISEKLGFLPGEKMLICLPIRFSLAWINPSPWAVVRIGYRGTDDSVLQAEQKELFKHLLPATMALLTETFK